MRKILSSRIFRILVCLVLICALLINVSPIKARADVVSGGLVAAGATGAVVSVPVAIAIGATLIALGIIADAASRNPYALQELASQVGDALAAAGTYVKDGMVEMYRFITDTGEAVYYAGADFMEAVRTHVYEGYCGGLFDEASLIASYGSAFQSRIDSLSAKGYTNVWCFVTSSGHVKFFYDMHPECIGPVLASDGDVGRICSYGYTAYLDGVGCTYVDPDKYASSFRLSFYDSSWHGISYGLAIQNFLTVPIDGTSARTWSEAYANRGLYIASGGNQGAPDDGGEGNDGWKFLLPLSLVAGGTLYAMSQADQWTGSTPPEFGDYTTEEELTVTPAPEFDGYQAIEIAPAPNTNPDPGTGTNPDPGTGTNPDPGTGTNPDPGTGTNPDPGTGTNPGTGTDPDFGSSSWQPPSDPKQFQLVDLSKFFPFCIPFDLFEFFKLLNSDPVAPVLHWEIQDLSGQTYSLTVDLSEWDSVALLFRRLQLFLFVTGLAAASRKFIKW